MVLGQLGPEVAKDAIPDLVAALQATDIADAKLAALARVGAIWALGQMGAEAKVALPALRAARNDPDEHVRSVAKEAVKKLEKIK